MYKFTLIDKISFILVLIGSINWGLFGLFSLDLVRLIFGNYAPLLARIIYIIIGVSALDLILLLIKLKRQEIRPI